MLKNLGLSGFSLAAQTSADMPEPRPPELLTKWIEIAAFQPIDRDHAEKSSGDHEPWANGAEQEAIRRRFIEDRYKLLPYLYTVMETGHVPVFRCCAPSSSSSPMPPLTVTRSTSTSKAQASSWSAPICS